MAVSIGYAVNDINALKALDVSDLVTGYSRLVKSKNAWYIYNSSSTTTANNESVIQPDAGSGRWFISKSELSKPEEFILLNILLN